MYSFTLLALASSALALPIVGPVAVVGPVKAIAPVVVKAANVDVKHVNVANDDGSFNKVGRRDYSDSNYGTNYGDSSYSNDYNNNNGGYSSSGEGSLVDVDAPVKALASVVADVKAPVDVAVANVNLKDIKGLNGIADHDHIGKRQYQYGDDGYGDDGSLVDVVAPLTTVAKVGAKVIAPVEAKVANVDVSKVNVANGVLSGDTISLRGAITDLPTVIRTAHADVNTIVGQIKDLLASSAAPSELEEPLKNLKDALASAIKYLRDLEGLQVNVILGQAESQVTLQQVAGIVSGLGETVAYILQDVQNKAGYEHHEIYASIGETVHKLLKTVTSLVPSICVVLRGVLGNVVQIFGYIGITIDLSSAGM